MLHYKVHLASYSILLLSQNSFMATYIVNLNLSTETYTIEIISNEHNS